MITLYHREGAGRPVRARWALEEAGASYEYVVMSAEEAAADAHLERHPLGKVPVLDIDGGYVWESAAICLQVADLFPEAGLIGPVGSHERGLVYQWVVYAMSELEAPVVTIAIARRENDDAALAAGVEKLDTALVPISAALEGRKYLLGPFTIADVVIGGVLALARRLEILPASDIIGGYLERLEQRAARQRAYAA